jgi:hypothetical protein
MSFLGCFKTAVKLNLLDNALNLALDRLNLTFSIEKFVGFVPHLPRLKRAFA